MLIDPYLERLVIGSKADTRDIFEPNRETSENQTG